MAIICVVYPRTIPSTFGDMNASYLTMEQLRIAYGLDALCKPLEKLDAIALFLPLSQARGLLAAKVDATRPSEQSSTRSQ